MIILIICVLYYANLNADFDDYYDSAQIMIMLMICVLF
jgi:hypothetical protein